MSEIRDAETLKFFIHKNVKNVNRIVTGVWAGYQFLHAYNSPNEHSVHNHGHEDLGYEIDSTSHIESLLYQMKGLIK